MLTRRHSGHGLGLSAMFAVVTLLCVLLACGERASDLSWPEVTKERKPWTYWWWLGSAVDEPNLTEHLEAYRKAGMGGVHIIPIYGVKGLEDRYIPYLSARWMGVLGHTIEEAKRLDMGVDMSTGTGWPFGGPWVRDEDATAKMILQTYSLDAGKRLDKPVKLEDKKSGEAAHLQALMAYSDNGGILDLTEKADEGGNLDWAAPAGKWELYAVFQGLGGKKVERAAPGGEGWVVDPFSFTALKKYLDPFDSAFGSYQGARPRAFYHDSYEYGRCNWTDDMFEEFKSRRGYDLRGQLPALVGRGPEDVVARVKCDYRETVSDLLLERFIVPWVKWSGEKGIMTRNQAHGSPGNLLDLYAAADIPETEIFGPSGFEIPGLRMDRDFDFHDALTDPLMLKFASSAANVTGKSLVSSESCTWLGEHFRVALSQVKPEIDQLLVSGINHVFYHGMAYSPFEEAWPGWLFYASTNFGPTNSFWRDLPALNSYIGRCQSVLQSGRSDNDILLYWPIYDVWHNKGGMLYKFSVHGIGSWLHGSPFHETAKTLWHRGYSFDYVSDRLLAEAEVSADRVRMGDGKYRVVIVPRCHLMPLGTLEKLAGLAGAGATIIVQGGLPEDVPGLGELEKRRRLFRKTLAGLRAADRDHSDVSEARLGKGRFLIGSDLEKMLASASVFREPIVDHGIKFVRRSHEQGHHYFLANPGKRRLDGWVRLGVKAKSVVIFDPLSGGRGLAAVREGKNGATEIYLQLEPGESCILRTFSSRRAAGSRWRYLRASGRATEIRGTWRVRFVEGGPELPGGFETDALASWVELSDAEAKRFAGTGVYTITFDQPAGSADDWVLELGRVCESARVRINGQEAGTLWSVPFKIAVGRFLREGRNTLEVEVTNLSANRIADLDRRNVYWKKFHEINFVDIRYRRFDASEWPATDSGLLGPVRLIPQVFVEPSE